MGYYRAAPPNELPALLSAERLGTYHRHTPAGGCEPVEFYLFGVELTVSFKANLALVEVALRNSMNAQLTRVYGPQWWADEQLLDQRRQAAVAKAWRDGRCRPSAPPGRVIAQLPLGFWVGLPKPGGYVGKAPYRQRRYHNAKLWRPALRHAFPHSTGIRTDVHGIAHRIYALRNRVAHHEPVIAGVRVPGTCSWEAEQERGVSVVPERRGTTASAR